MVLIETLASRLENVIDFEAYQSFLHARRENKQFNFESREIKKLQSNDRVDEDYKDLLLSILTKEEMVEPCKRRKERKDNINHCDSNEENDPQYEDFFKHLKEHEKSYMLEYVKDGIPLAIKYELGTTSDQESDHELKRKLRAKKQENGIPNDDIPIVENKRGHNIRRAAPIKVNLTRSKSRKEGKSDIVETVKRSTDGVLIDMDYQLQLENANIVETVKRSNIGVVTDMDYIFFLENSKLVGDDLVFKYGDDMAVNHMVDGENGSEKENRDDDNSSDVEIIEVNGQKAGALTFREDLMILLKKPFDRDEYNTRLEEIKQRKRKFAHRELRGGRERALSTHRDGKSYLDLYPDVKCKLGQYYPELGKFLNILRGFFFWLENSPREGSFIPWKDEECLSVEPIYN